MKQPVRFVVLLLFLITSTATSAGERYSVRMLEQGNQYFFMPCKLKGANGTRLEYDMTLLSFRDSVSLNMTLTAPLGRVQTISLAAGEDSFSTSDYELYFQEREGSRFNTRIHIDCPNDAYASLFTAGQPLTITITMEDNRHYSFTYNGKQWNKERGFVAEVLEMIAYSNSRQ